MYICRGIIINTNSMDEIKKTTKKAILSNHQYLYLFCNQFCLYVKFIQQPYPFRHIGCICKYLF